MLVAWGIIRFIPDLLESIQATAKYGKWSYAHLLVFPQSALLTIVVLVIGLGLIFSDTIQKKLHEWRKPEPFITQPPPEPEMFTREQKERMRSVAGIEPTPVPEKHPDIILEWTSPRKGDDKIKFRNIGERSGFGVTLGPFSWPELSFLVPPQINALHPNEPVEVEPQFMERLGEDRTTNVGHMGIILGNTHYNGREPLRIEIAFSDSDGLKFVRDIILKRGHGGIWGPEIIVELGDKLRTTF
ncbi:MAG TPA: hypothetical protein VLA42_18180 [Verrucomicrobiae bacterium]|nr:hypothetical protein [Verrucomicrobiae bacterium]